jgi:hypothetical protein
VPQGVDLADVLRGQRRHEYAASRLRSEQSVSLKQAHRLPERRPAHLELGGNPLFRNALAWPILAAEDPPSELAGDGVDQRRGVNESCFRGLGHVAPPLWARRALCLQ